MDRLELRRRGRRGRRSGPRRPSRLAAADPDGDGRRGGGTASPAEALADGPARRPTRPDALDAGRAAARRDAGDHGQERAFERTSHGASGRCDRPEDTTSSNYLSTVAVGSAASRSASARSIASTIPTRTARTSATGRSRLASRATSARVNGRVDRPDDAPPAVGQHDPDRAAVGRVRDAPGVAAPRASPGGMSTASTAASRASPRARTASAGRPPASGCRPRTRTGRTPVPSSARSRYVPRRWLTEKMSNGSEIRRWGGTVPVVSSAVRASAPAGSGGEPLRMPRSLRSGDPVGEGPPLSAVSETAPSVPPMVSHATPRVPPAQAAPRPVPLPRTWSFGRTEIVAVLVANAVLILGMWLRHDGLDQLSTLGGHAHGDRPADRPVRDLPRAHPARAHVAQPVARPGLRHGRPRRGRIAGSGSRRSGSCSRTSSSSRPATPSATAATSSRSSGRSSRPIRTC